MSMIALDDLGEFFAGAQPLPIGAVPLARETSALGSVVCLTALGRWVRWWPGTRSLESMPPDTQRAVVAALAERLGGTSAAMAERLGVSVRTVEGWRSGRAALPIRAAYEIAKMAAAGD